MRLEKWKSLLNKKIEHANTATLGFKILYTFVNQLKSEESMDKAKILLLKSVNNHMREINKIHSNLISKEDK